jgi:hypothetical protein
MVAPGAGIGITLYLEAHVIFEIYITHYAETLPVLLEMCIANYAEALFTFEIFNTLV